MSVSTAPVRGSAEPSGGQPASRLGPPQSSALVVGSIVGVGIFSLPLCVENRVHTVKAIMVATAGR